MPESRAAILVEPTTPLDRGESERLLRFCLDRGVDRFSANFVYWNDAQLRRANKVFFDRLAPYRLGQHLLPRTVIPAGGKHSELTECWSLNRQTIELILDAAGGSLTSHETGRFPEDWTFYRNERVFCGIVSHEQYAFLELSNDDLPPFERLGLTFTRKN